jgi:hypothetical protein
MKWHSIEKYLAVRCEDCNKFKFISDFPEDDRSSCFACLVRKKLGQKQLDITVRPKAYPVTGCGNVWEFTLLNKGFNELPRIKQYGLIKNAFNTGEIEVYWPHVDITTFVFSDEIELPWEEK